MKRIAVILLCAAGTLFGNDTLHLNDFIKDPNAADHTAYIQTAMKTAARKQKALRISGGRSYRLTDTVNISGVPEIIGEGYPCFIMENPEKDVFYSNSTWRIHITGIVLKGGRDQLALGNRNVDRGQIIISNCRFIKSNGAAIRFLKGTASTLCIVEKCVFDFCRQALITVSDHCHFSDSWIQTAMENPKNLPVIENHNYLVCNNIVGVPLVVNSDLRWIDNYGHNLTCRNFRFGGEGGGFTPVVNKAKYFANGWGKHILLEDCSLFAQGNTVRKTAVYCEEFPNSITIRDSQIMGIPPLMLSQQINVKNYFNQAHPGMILLNISGNVGEFLKELPAGLKEAISQVEKNIIHINEQQLSPEATSLALKTALEKAGKIASPAQPAVSQEKGQKKHLQQIVPGAYRSITMKSNPWLLSDNLDGQKIPCAEYLALGDAGESAIILSRTDRPTYPHIRIADVDIDLEQYPVLTWNLRDTGIPGGHIAVKIIDQSTGKQYELMEDYLDSQFRYCAFDLRKVLGQQTGKRRIDIKFYLCGVRIKNQGAFGKDGKKNMMKGEFFIIDFLRLEKADESGTTAIKADISTGKAS